MKILLFAYRNWARVLAKMVTDVREDLIIETLDVRTSKEDIDKFKPDLIFFIGWSWIIPKEIVDNYYCVCLHPSPLPKYRGGTPLQHQIIRGEKVSAVTLFKMTEELDKGPIVYQAPFSLEGQMDDIFAAITNVGFNGITQVIKDHESGNIVENPQIESEATYFKRRTPDMSEITVRDLTTLTAEDIYNKVRALADPYPNAYIMCRGKKLYLKETSIDD